MLGISCYCCYGISRVSGVETRVMMQKNMVYGGSIRSRRQDSGAGGG